MLVFLNYKQGVEPDHSLAKALEASLKSSGKGVFRDESGLRGGDLWAKKLLENVQKCDAMVSLVSNESMRSPWVINEIDEAIKRKKHIIPILLEVLDEELSFISYRPRLADRQFITYRGDPNSTVVALLKALETGPRFLYEDLIAQELAKSNIQNAGEVLCALLWFLKDDHIHSLAFGLDKYYRDGLDRLSYHKNRSLAESIAYYGRSTSAMHLHNAEIKKNIGKQKAAESLTVAGERIACLSRIIMAALSQWEPEVEETKRAIERTRKRINAQGKKGRFMFKAPNDNPGFDKEKGEAKP